MRALPLTIGISFAVLAACQHTPVEPEKSAVFPAVVNVGVYNNANNVLSAIVAVRTTNAAKVAIAFGDDSLLTQSTPLVQIAGDSARVPVLGLKANRLYKLRAVAISASGHETHSAPFSFQTRPLPDGLPRFSVVAHQTPSTGFVMVGFATTEIANTYYALIIDNDGEVVWYRRFPRPVVDFQKQANGLYTVYSSMDNSPLRFYALDEFGNIIQEFRAQGGLETGQHELRLLNDGYCLFGIEFPEMNLTAVGGAPNTIIRSPIVEYHRSNAPVLLWRAVDHFQVTDAAPDISLTTSTVNPWHGNAIEIDSDNNLLVSFRNRDEITKINSRTGEIIWRLGGKNNQFTFVNDPLNGFSHQHGIRRLANGNIILFDNGNLHAPPVSRAVEYKLDEHAKVAELVWEYRSMPSLFSHILGFAQRLPNGNTLICYGAAQRVIEVDRSGTKHWELAVFGQNVFVYRAFRIASLY